MALVLRLVLLVLADLGLTACTPGDPARTAEPSATGGPQLRLLDSVTLQEHDTAYVGHVREFTVDGADGSFYVADRLAERILRFDRRGALLSLYGTKGRGPGEITGIGPMLATDSAVYVSAAGNARIERYVRSTGVPSAAFRLGGFVTSFVRDGNQAWLGNYDRERRTSVTMWEVDTERFQHLIQIPPEYERSPALGSFFPGVFVAPFGDSLLVGFMATPYLVVATRDGVVTDTVTVPVQRRRAYPADIDDAMEAQPPEQFAALSALFYAELLPTRELMLIYYDSYPRDGLMNSRVYVSLLSPDRRQACIDTELTVSQDTEPMMGFRGDTLFVLEGRVQGERAVSTVTRYHVSSAGCAWVPTT